MFIPERNFTRIAYGHCVPCCYPKKGTNENEN